MEKRLFIAINLPSNIKDQITDLLLKLQKNNKNKLIRWVKPNNLHLTLHFLGDTPQKKIPQINQVLKPLIKNYSPLNFSITNKISAFPNLNNPRVIFLEISELNQGRIFQLQQQIGEALKILGFKTDKRPFRLHLTLGRIKDKTNIQIPELLLPISNFQINSIELMESTLTPQGPLYSVISSYNLI